MKKKDFMKKLLYFMKDYKKESVLAPLFKMLEAFFELFVPLVVASISASKTFLEYTKDFLLDD